MKKQIFIKLIIRTAIGVAIYFVLTKTIPIIYIGLRLGVGTALMFLAK